MSTYWVAPHNPPSRLEVPWEDLHQAFGTEPFSNLKIRYTHVPSEDLGRVLDELFKDGSLGKTVKEF